MGYIEGHVKDARESDTPLSTTNVLVLELHSPCCCTMVLCSKSGLHECVCVRMKGSAELYHGQRGGGSVQLELATVRNTNDH